MNYMIIAINVAGDILAEHFHGTVAILLVSSDLL